MYVCMYVCMYTYVLLVSHVSCTCACTYISMTCMYTHMRTVMCLACVGPTMRATRAFIHTYDVAAHCGTVGMMPSLLGCNESTRTYICTYVLLGLL